MGAKPKKMHARTRSDLTNLIVLKAKYVKLVAKCGVMGAAAAKIGRTMQTIGVWRKDDADFDQAVLDAYDHSTASLRQMIYKRSMDRLDKSSATLAIFEMKRRDPEYRDRFDVRTTGTVNHTGKVSVELRAKLAGLPKDALQMIAERLKNQWDTRPPSIPPSST